MAAEDLEETWSIFDLTSHSSALSSTRNKTDRKGKEAKERAEDCLTSFCLQRNKEVEKEWDALCAICYHHVNTSTMMEDISLYKSLAKTL